MPTQTGSIDFKVTEGFSSYASGQYATLSQIKGQFATCSTAAGTQAKAATIVPSDTGWELYTGATITVKFTTANTHATPTLNVNSTGAKSIRDHTGAELSESAYKWAAGTAMSFTYDGTYWRMQDTLSQRVTTAETAIEQNAEAITFRATKEEASQMAQPNLTPYFLMPMTQSTDTYWDNITYTRFTQLEDGWAHFAYTNSGSSTVNNYIIPKVINTLTPGGRYTLLAEFRSVSISADGGMFYSQQNTYAQVWGTSNYGGFAINNSTIRALENGEGTFHVSLTLLTADSKDPSGTVRGSLPKTQFMSINQQVQAGQSISYDLRLSLYEGDYEGPYKPYVGSQLYASQAELKVTADGITSTVSSIASAKYVNSTTTSWPLASLKTYAAEGHSENWNVVSTDGFRVGDTVYVKGTDGTRNCTVYIKTTVTSVNSTTNFTGTSHGYEDVLPVDTVKSTINQSSDSVKIEARHVDIVGAAIFTTGRLSESSLNSTYDANGAAATVQTNLDNLQVGGRNLIKATGTTKTSAASASDSAYVSNYLMSDYGFSIMNNVDDVWVFSFDYTVQGNEASDAYIYAQVRGASISSGVDSSIQVNVFDAPSGHYSKRFKLTSAQAGSATNYNVRVRLRYATDGATFTVSNLKVEKGNKPTDWTPAPEDVTADALASGIEYIEGTQTAATNLWTGVTKETALVAGKSIAYKLPYAGTSTAATLNLTLAGGGTTGAKAVKMVYSTSSNTGALSNVTTHWPVNSIIQMTYDGTQWVISNYNTNVDDKNARNVRFYNTIVAGEALAAASIIGMHADGKFYQVKEQAYFLLSAPLLWLTTAKEADATNADAIYTHAYDVNLGTYYTSFVNTTKNCTVYLVGTVSGNIFSTYGSSSAQYLTVTEPTTEDDRFYIPLGRLGNASTGKNYFNYVVDYPVSLYAYLDGEFRQVTPTEIVASHRIYYRTTSSTKPSAPNTTWVAEATTNTYDAWTTKIPPLSLDKDSATATKYLYLYTCEQRKRLDGTIQCTDVQLDENTTVIDGGNIITSTVTANQLSANAVTAEKIAANALTLGKFTAADKLLVDNSQVQVGGRNLLRFTAVPNYVGSYTLWTSGTSPSGWYSYRTDAVITRTDDGIKFTGGATNNDGFVIPITKELESDVEYALSFDYRGTLNGTGALYVMCRTTPNVQIASIALDNSGEWAHFESVVSWSGLDGKTPYALLVPYRNKASGWIEIRDSSIKLEKGNKATDWTPAPEDQTAYVDDSISSLQVGGRNFLRDTQYLTGWQGTNGTTISSDGVATFPAVSANTWRELYPSINFRYANIRNQTVTFSAKVKAADGAACSVNFCIGVDTAEDAYARKKYRNQQVNFTGTGTWVTVMATADITDAWFTAGSGTVDFDDCWVTVRPGAWNTFYPSFQLKELKLELGNKATDWSPAPEDQTNYVDSSVGTVATDLSQLSGGLGELSDNLTNATGEIGELKKKVGSLAGEVEGLTATTQWLSFNENDGLTIGDSDNFYTQQKGSEMTFNQVANGTQVELMSLSGTNGIMGPRVTVTDQISTPLMVSENWAISLSGDMFSIDYIGE